jgi:hypothetical protein
MWQINLQPRLQTTYMDERGNEGRSEVVPVFSLYRGDVHLACLFLVAVADSGQGIFILLASISDS